jgi:PKD repeat protein
MSRTSQPGSSCRHRSKGQSLTEFALILPVLLLIVLVAIDFGRVYLGWINLQNVARIAAGYAANHPEAWDATPDVTVQGRYAELVENETTAINCDLTGGVREPIFIAGYDLGDPVEVGISCQFSVITPGISAVLGNRVLVTASASYPVRTGNVGTLPGGGGGAPVVQAPIASFVGSPRTGYAPLTVQFTDTSLRRPTSWLWTFQGAGTSLQRDPSVTWTAPGTYSVTLTVANSGGTNALTETAYITVVAPPTTGPIPEFSATPRAGNDPLDVRFTDQSTGAPTAWSWNFGDGTAPSTAQNPNHRYQNPGVYTVSLTVTNAAGSNTQTKDAYIYVDAIPCRVPSFFNRRKNEAQGLWSAAGFTTQVQFQAGQGNYLIKTQSLAGSFIPEEGCAATITVGP